MTDDGRRTWRRLPRDVQSLMVLARALAIPLIALFVSFDPGTTLASAEVLAVTVGLLGGILAELRPRSRRTETLTIVCDVLVVAGAATVTPISPFGSYSPLGLLLVAGWGARRSGLYGFVVGLAMAAPISAWFLIEPDGTLGDVIGPIGTLPWLGLLVGWAAQKQNEAADTIRRQAAELAETHREVSRYAGRVAHDLKNPLTALAGFAKMADADAAAAPGVPDSIRKATSHILRCTGSLLAQVDALYTASSAPHVPLQTGVVDLVELTLDAAEDLPASSEVLELHLGDLPEVAADGRLLRLVMLNLLSNAIAHGRGGRGRVQVTVSASLSGGRVVVEVADDGPGIDPVDTGDALEHGVRGGSSTGSGFGLGTCATVIARHDGTLHLGRSAAGGLLVRFDLPAA